MNEITTAIYALLAADSALVALIGSYAGVPKIFAVAPAPRGCDLPTVVFTLIGGDSDGSKTTKARVLTFQISVFVDKIGSRKLADQIAERIIQLLHRVDIATTSFYSIIASCEIGVELTENWAYHTTLSYTINFREK